MPLYEYYCETCRRRSHHPDVISAHDEGGVDLSPLPWT